jgi:hypothetical protein
MEVTDFDGTFKGSGQEVTILDTFEDQDCQAWIDTAHTSSAAAKTAFAPW